MRFINREKCRSISEKGESREIKSMGVLTRDATKIAEQNRLGVLKTRQCCYRIIKECGLGAYEDFFTTLAEVDDFLKHLNRHEGTKY